MVQGFRGVGLRVLVVIDVDLLLVSKGFQQESLFRSPSGP